MLIAVSRQDPSRGVVAAPLHSHECVQPCLHSTDRASSFLSVPFTDLPKPSIISFYSEIMHLQETILCSTGPVSANNGPGAISLHDIQTGSALASFKQTSASPHCTCFFESRGNQGGFILAAQPDKSILNVYSFQKVRRGSRS